MAKNKVLVIGGAGYIGSHVVKSLLENGYGVAVFDNMSSGQKANLFTAADFIKGDINDFAALDAEMQKGYDAIVHLAAKKAVGESMAKPDFYAQNNLIGSINIFNAMLKNGVKNVLFSSSAAVYGTPKYLPVDEKHPTEPINFYGFTKLEIEHIMEWYHQLKDFNYTVFRFFNAVGYAADGAIKGKEQNPQNLLPIIMEVLSGKREKISVFGNDYDTPDGTCVRDYIHVEDLANAHVLALKKMLEAPQSHTFNLGTGKGTSVLEVIKACEKVSAKKVNYDFAPRRSGDPAVLVATGEKAEKILGWKPKYTNIEDIVRTTWNMEIKNND